MINVESKSEVRLSPGLSVVVACVFVLKACVAVAASIPHDLQTRPCEAFTEMEADFVRVVQAHGHHPVVKAYQKRAVLVDQVAALLIRRLSPPEQKQLRHSSDTNHASRQDRADTSKEANSTPSPRYNNLNQGPSASDILKQYGEQFVVELPMPSENGLRVLKDYLDAKLNLAADHVARLGSKEVVAGGKPTVETVRLSLIIPILRTSDQEWTDKHISTLPRWMKLPQSLNHAESFALTHGRPLTAYCIASFQRRTGGTRADAGELDRGTYFSKAARRLAQGGDLSAAVDCLKAGASFSEQRGDKRSVAKIRFQLASRLEDMGYVHLAADEMKAILGDGHKGKDWTKACKLRLTYLIKAKELDAADDEAKQYREDPRAKPCLPQLCYIEWFVNYRQGRKQIADCLYKTFVAQYPDHPLGADMRFASAMHALSRGDYRKAEILLKAIEDLHPNSRIISKVRRIRRSLSKVDAKPER